VPHAREKFDDQLFRLARPDREHARL